MFFHYKLKPIFLVLIIFICSNGFSQNAIPFLTKDNKYTFVDTNFKVVNPNKFNMGSSDFEYHNGLIPVTKDDKQGLVDFYGKEVTGLKYNNIGSYKGKYFGYRIVRNNKFGACLFNGKDSIPCIYDVLNFENGELGLIQKDDKYYIKGELIKVNLSRFKNITPIQIGSFQYMFLASNYRGYYGFLDSTFNEIIPCKYYAVSFEKNIILARLSSSETAFEVFNLKGKLLTNQKVYETEYISENYILYKTDKTVEKKNAVVKKPKYETKQVIQDQPPNSKLNFYWECLDVNNGKKVIQEEIEYFDKIDNSFVIKGLKNNYLVGKKVIPFPKKYDQIVELANGSFIAHKERYYGLLDKDFKIKIPFTYDNFFKADLKNFLMQKNEMCYIFNQENKITDSVENSSLFIPQSDGDYEVGKLLILERNVYDIKAKKNIISNIEIAAKVGNFYVVRNNFLCGLMDSTGKFVVPCIYESFMLPFNYSDELTPEKSKIKGVWFQKNNLSRLFVFKKSILLEKEITDKPYYRMINNFFLIENKSEKLYIMDDSGRVYKEN